MKFILTLIFLFKGLVKTKMKREQIQQENNSILACEL